MEAVLWTLAAAYGLRAAYTAGVIKSWLAWSGEPYDPVSIAWAGITCGPLWSGAGGRRSAMIETLQFGAVGIGPTSKGINNAGRHDATRNADLVDLAGYNHGTGCTAPKPDEWRTLRKALASEEPTDAAKGD